MKVNPTYLAFVACRIEKEFAPKVAQNLAKPYVPRGLAGVNKNGKGEKRIATDGDKTTS